MMKRLFILAIGGAILGLLAATIMTDSGLMPVAAQGNQPGEIWRAGVTNEGAVTYATTLGRSVAVAQRTRSARPSTDFYMIFPAPSQQRTILAAQYRIIARSGSYTGNAILTLEVLNLAGAVQQTVTASGVDIEAVATDTWTSFTLSGTAANLVIEPGEFLVARVNLDGAANTDNLQVDTVFSIEVD
jgi:hypothetical protein